VARLLVTEIVDNCRMLRQEDLDELWDFSDPVGSESRLLAAAESSEHRAELLTQVARALGLQDRFTEAAALLDSLPDDGVRVPLERGRLANSSGSPGAAIPLFRTAAENASGFLKIDALHMLAIADGDNASTWTTLALDEVDASDDARVKRWATSLHNNLGWTLHDAGDLPGALSSFEHARDAAVTDEQRHIANWTIAHTLRLLGQTTEARTLLESLDQSDPYVTEELAELDG
jgi:tetratricopeptide (TPR) repeat protein